MAGSLLLDGGGCDHDRSRGRRPCPFGNLALADTGIHAVADPALQDKRRSRVILVEFKKSADNLRTDKHLYRIEN